MTMIKRLGDAELEIMLAIWNADGPVTSTYVLEQLVGKRDWKLSTLMTVLARLVDKGFLKLIKQGRSNFYAPLVDEEEYRRSEGKNVLEKLFDNNLKAMVSSLVGGKAVTEEELTDLREYLETMEK